MTKKLTLLTFLTCICSFSLFAQTVLKGKVSDQDGGVIGATVALFQNGTELKVVGTDYDGNFIFSNINPGNYDVEVASLGLATKRINGVFVEGGNTTQLDFDMKEDSELIEGVEIVDYVVPLIKLDQTSQVKTVTAEGIKNSPLKSISALASTSGGISTDKNGNISMRGSRSSATNYYVDGIRVTNSSLIPASEIEQLQIITGGLAAKYGDVTGGVISLTSKGPSEKFTGGVELETSQFLDPYGYNFLNGSVSGPIWKRNGKSVLGFRLNAQYITQVDDNPSAVGVYRMPESIIKDLEENPTFELDGVQFPRAELLTKEDLPTPLKVRPNEHRKNLNLVGKIDARLSNAIDVSLSGIYNKGKNRFTPSYYFGMLNWTKNPFSYSDNYRVNFRWRHKLGQQDLSANAEDAKGSTVIRNASYTIQLGYENTKGHREDFVHENRFFDYGLYGTREITQRPSIGFVDADWKGAGALDLPFGRVDHVTFASVIEPFSRYVDEKGEKLSPNPVASKFQNVNGVRRGTSVNVWSSSFFGNVGQVYNLYSKFDNNTATLNFSAQLDLLPGGSIDNRHNIEFGGTYEQRNSSRWSLNPRDLWTMARDAANSHIIAGVDTTTFTGNVFTSTAPFPPGLEFREYGRLFDIDSDKKFYKAIRDLHKLSLNDYVNIDGRAIVEKGITLDMFSASELIQWRNIGLNYYGFDYLGNKVSGGSFDDFFTATNDDDGRRTFPVAPVAPTYISGYIQDKFSYEKIILRVGVRADYFDANTKVLKDPYSLYAIETAKEFSDRRDLQFPSSLDPNAKVYLEGSDKDNAAVKAYRLGDEWYLPNGTKTDPNLIFGGEPVNPSYVYPDSLNNVQSKIFDPNHSFTDYQPSTKFTPRISLSFPISEEAGFFAHYDQLVQRPSSNTRFTALDYYNFTDKSRLNSNGSPANNPNLRPETTIDYEVGFQQLLTEKSSIKLAAYYKENRDLIQSRYILNVPIINDYLTYDNIDFGTVKGFTATYDLRRVGNIQLNGSYTLQYAEGTGSSANSGLSSRNGELRVLIPLSFDVRHRLVGNIDYRYGREYNGPRIAGVDLFANMGLNLQVSAVSGRPYTKRSTINTPFNATGFTGDINGSRLPWQYNVDARLDRNFFFKFNEDGSKGLNFNVYLRVSNLFNTKNIVGNYRVTGSPDDDGFLNTQYGQDAIKTIEESGKDVKGYLAAYEWTLLNPGFYTLPRRIRIGTTINF